MTSRFFQVIFSAIIVSLFLISCAEEEVTEPTTENLLLNTSFEENGKFSVAGWSLPALYDSSTDVPPNGGSYSLLLSAIEPPEEYAFIKVPVKTQYTINKLSFWAKSTGVTSGIYGKATLSLVRNGATLKSKSIFVDEIVWRNFSIQDTFNIAQGDSFLVQLSGGVSQLLSAKADFDLVQLQGIK